MVQVQEVNLVSKYMRYWHTLVRQVMNYCDELLHLQVGSLQLAARTLVAVVGHNEW